MLMGSKDYKILVGVISRQRAVKGELHRLSLLKHGIASFAHAKSPRYVG
jgi:hypothetical protein